MARAASGAIEAGSEALLDGRWDDARAHFESAIAQDGSAEAWDGLATASRWGGDADTAFRARQEAYRLWCDAGDGVRAAGAATRMASDTIRLRGDEAVASGWFARAERLLADAGDVPERALLALERGALAFDLRSDAPALIDAAGLALRVGQESGNLDLEMRARALRGLGRVKAGEVEGGMRDLDEAATAAYAGEVRSAVGAGAILCNLIAACELVRDVERAGQWLERVREHAERTQIRQLFAYCRTHYATVLTATGSWDEAEAHLEQAAQDFQASAPAGAYAATVALAELRRRQGRFDEAAALVADCGWHHGAQLCLAELAWDKGDTQQAREVLDRRNRRIAREVRASDAAGLELEVRLRVAAGERAAAASAAERLADLAAAAGTTALLGAARLAAGLLAQGAEAREALEDAVDLLESAGVPFEAARAHAALGRALAAAGRDELADLHWQRAAHHLSRLGSSRDPRALDAPLEGRREREHELSRREVEVLRLVADGLSDHDIAERLVLSPHTVHRHVANIRAKLRQPSRAAAAARAARDGLI
jgi:DNA-binding NarL/FixJ family response regulator